MVKSRAFEYTLVFVLVLILVGVFGQYVLLTHQKMAYDQLSTAYHAMQTAVVLVHTRCQVDVSHSCEQAGVVHAIGGQKIRVVQGYPAASMHGIVLASGLDAKTFVVREVPSGVQVYMTHQPNNLQCRVLYQLPEGLNESATVTMQASRC